MNRLRRFLRDNYIWERDATACYTLACQLIGVELAKHRSRIIELIKGRARVS